MHIDGLQICRCSNKEESSIEIGSPVILNQSDSIQLIYFEFILRLFLQIKETKSQYSTKLRALSLKR